MYPSLPPRCFSSHKINCLSSSFSSLISFTIYVWIETIKRGRETARGERERESGKEGEKEGGNERGREKRGGERERGREKEEKEKEKEKNKKRDWWFKDEGGFELINHQIHLPSRCLTLTQLWAFQLQDNNQLCKNNMWQKNYQNIWILKLCRLNTFSSNYAGIQISQSSCFEDCISLTSD